jgi:hypothetical protein
MPARHKLGTMSPVIFTRCRLGHVVLLPYTECPTPAGCEFQYPLTHQPCGQPVIREGADTLAAIDALQRKLTDQENEKGNLEQQFDIMQTEAVRQRVRDSLYAKMISAATPEAEKEFIRAYLNLRQELRQKHHQKWNQYVVYINAREFDVGKRGDVGERNP